MSCPLTRKQLWRRIYSRNRHVPLSVSNEGVNPEDGSISIRVSSEPTLNGSSNHSMDRGWKTTGDLNKTSSIRVSKPKEKETSKRKLKFDQKVRVILIPTREEYYATGLGDVLWWSCDDYTSFKQAAGIEFRAMLALCNMDAKAAIALMYQSDAKYTIPTVPAYRKVASTSALSSVQFEKPHVPLSHSDSTLLLHSNFIQVDNDESASPDMHANIINEEVEEENLLESLPSTMHVNSIQVVCDTTVEYESNNNNQLLSNGHHHNNNSSSIAHTEPNTKHSIDNFETKQSISSVSSTSMGNNEKNNTLNKSNTLQIITFTDPSMPKVIRHPSSEKIQPVKTMSSYSLFDKSEVSTIKRSSSLTDVKNADEAEKKTTSSIKKTAFDNDKVINNHVNGHNSSDHMQSEIPYLSTPHHLVKRIQRNVDTQSPTNIIRKRVESGSSNMRGHRGNNNSSGSNNNPNKINQPLPIIIS